MSKNKPKAHILEIFSSIQGEGPYVGIKQIFIRFRGCNLRCSFCDTDSFGKSEGFSVDEILGKLSTLKKENPNIHFISLTGGEPLLHSRFLGKLLPKLKKMNFKIFLETNGTLPEKLMEIINFVDIISMDIKLPSTTGKTPFWGEHKRFLKIALKKEVYIKTLISSTTKEEEFLRSVNLVRDIDKDIPFVIQPVSAKNGIKPPLAEKLLKFQTLASRNLKEVRIIPQIHKILGVK
ncbi:MAG: 7-carboxy-7-deazaguanine synthase QueE [Candidatus Omnitrophica bacterium]|nr:7-carboxy-7-deazaguanine synthase QueE [Candidatus Omnitrophota bacterium]